MTIVATDGYEYADLTQRLLGQPLKNPRNTKLSVLTEAGYPREEVQAFFKAYDKARGKHPDKEQTGWSALNKQRQKNRKANDGDDIRHAGQP